MGNPVQIKWKVILPFLPHLIELNYFVHWKNHAAFSLFIFMDTILFRIPDKKKSLLPKSCTNIQLWNQELESEINSDPNHPDSLTLGYQTTFSLKNRQGIWIRQTILFCFLFSWVWSALETNKQINEVKQASAIWGCSRIAAILYRFQRFRNMNLWFWDGSLKCTLKKPSSLGISLIWCIAQ